MPFHNGSAFEYNMGSPTMFNRIRNFKLPAPAAPRGRTRCGPCCDPKQINLKTAKAFVLSCMDFRLRDCQVCHLNRKGYKNNYDEVIAAGASLGYNGLATYSGWKQYIEEHFELGYALHKISEIIIIDHDKCGAYAVQYPEIVNVDGSVDSAKEREHHITDLTECVDELWGKYNPVNGSKDTTIPNLKIKAYLISVDGGKLELIYSKE